MKILLTKREVRDLVLYSFAHIDRMEAKGEFPKRVRLGNARVGWVKDEVLAWLQLRISALDGSTT